MEKATLENLRNDFWAVLCCSPLAVSQCLVIQYYYTSLEPTKRKMDCWEREEDLPSCGIR